MRQRKALHPLTSPEIRRGRRRIEVLLHCGRSVLYHRRNERTPKGDATVPQPTPRVFAQDSNCTIGIVIVVSHKRFARGARARFLVGFPKRKENKKTMLTHTHH